MEEDGLNGPGDGGRRGVPCSAAVQAPGLHHPAVQRFQGGRVGVDAFLDELGRASLLSIPYLVMHLGSHMGRGEAAGITAIAESIRNCYADAECQNTVILLETTAGQGTNLGLKISRQRSAPINTPSW